MVTGKRFAYKRKSPYKKRKMVYKKKVTPKMKSAIKRIVRSTVEPRQATQLTGNSITNVIHRSMYYCTPLSVVSVGTSDNQRIASQIWVKGIRLKMMVNRKSAFYDDIRIRVLAFYEPENDTDWTEVLQTTWAGATADMISGIFSLEGSGLETINNELFGVKPIYDKNYIYKSNNYGSVSSSVTKSAKPTDIYIPINRNIRYRSSGSTTVPHRQLFLAFYVYGGGLVSTDLTQLFDLSSFYTVYYRDV